ncbi:hypothetical protein [Marinagarivorans algicola]|uniref:hypothetical protein n=1 Tax=Marinagarivorans algicola TaxID=1513270 RepID=UPI003736BA52
MPRLTQLNRRPLNRCIWRTLALCVTASISTSSCNNNGAPQGPPPAPTATQIALPMAAVHTLTLTVWQSQQLQLEQAIQAATVLQRSVSALLADPNTTTLQNAQQRWQQLALSIEPLAILGALAATQRQDQLPNSPLQPQLKNTANWSTISLYHGYIAAWPAELGFLDNNGTQGNTGLIFNLDIMLNEETLKDRHRQTDQQEAALGLYPLGLMLHGAQTPRQVSQLHAVTALTPKHESLGLREISEHPHNRRRQLIAQQTQALRHHLMQLKSQLFKRDSQSALNAFSQQTVAQQQAALAQAAQQLSAQQLQELTQYHNDDMPLWQQHWQYQRLQAQLTGLELWLSLLGYNPQASLCQNLLRLLASHISALSTDMTPSAHRAQDTQVDSDHAPVTSDNTALRQQLAELTVALRQAARMPAPNTTK